MANDFYYPARFRYLGPLTDLPSLGDGAFLPGANATTQRDFSWLVEELCDPKGQILLAMGGAGSGKSMLCQQVSHSLSSRGICLNKITDIFCPFVFTFRTAHATA